MVMDQRIIGRLEKGNGDIKEREINMQVDIIKQVRDTKPLVHHLTNQVVMNFSANGLLSFGGSPIMAKAIEEVEQIAAISNAVLINIGTLTSTELESMIAAGKTANKHNIPVLLDPVGVAATSFRRNAIDKILEEVRPTVIKGNAGELASLVNINLEAKGVDSIGDGNLDVIAQKVSEKYNTAVVVTGETDVIYVDNHLIHNGTGHHYLSSITGSGCLLGSIIAACLTTKSTLKDQLMTAVSFYGLSASYAANQENVHGTGSFLPVFIDSLSKMPQELTEGE